MSYECSLKEIRHLKTNHINDRLCLLMEKKTLAEHYTLVFDRGTRRICANIKITKSLTKQQLQRLKGSTTFSLKRTGFFCKACSFTVHKVQNKVNPKHNRISPSGFVPYQVVKEGFWTLLTRRCGFCSSDVHSTYPILKGSILSLSHTATQNIIRGLHNLITYSK